MRRRRKSWKVWHETSRVRLLKYFFFFFFFFFFLDRWTVSQLPLIFLANHVRLLQLSHRLLFDLWLVISTITCFILSLFLLHPLAYLPQWISCLYLRLELHLYTHIGLLPYHSIPVLSLPLPFFLSLSLSLFLSLSFSYPISSSLSILFFSVWV